MGAVTTAWESIDWERIQARVETEVELLGKRQDDSEIRRVKLVEESNAYRNRTTKESRTVALPLIKAFQSEFDELLARSAAAESALIDLCKSIVNLPDPKAILKGSEGWKNGAEKTKKVLEEREDLKRQLLKANSELEEFRGRDVKVRRLKDKLAKLESDQDAYIETAVKEVEKRALQELNKQIDEMVSENEIVKEHKEILEKSVETLETKNKEMQRKLEIAEKTAEQINGLENEQLTITIKDLADARSKIVFLEQRISQLECEENANEIKNVGKIEDIAALGSVLVQKDEQIQQLTKEMKLSEARYAEDVANLKSSMTALEKKNSSLSSELEALKNQLERCNDYEDIKNELRLLRDIEFGGAAEANADSIERLGETVETLDRLLAEKNRRLQNENASLRGLSDELKARTEEQEKEIFALKEVSEKNDRLVVQLERDLANAVQDLGRTGELSTSIETTPIQNSDTSLLPILSSQRHRLHERVTNLEQTVSCEKAKNLSLESEIEKVRAENIKMVERIRFLQSTDQKSYNVEVGYLNEFGNSKKMTAHDKVTLNIGKTILASPRSRSVFFSYLLILHVLIMLVLYNFAFNQSVMRDAETECEYKFHQHMLDKHGH